MPEESDELRQTFIFAEFSGIGKPRISDEKCSFSGYFMLSFLLNFQADSPPRLNLWILFSINIKGF